MGTINEISHKAQRTAFSVAIDAVLKHLGKDRERELINLTNIAEKYLGNDHDPKVYDKIREDIKDPSNKWMKYIDKLLSEIDPHVVKKTALNLGYEAAFRGTKMIRKNREVYGCNIPWLILFDPTSACNMHCTGCWSGNYGIKHNLSFEDMDKIVTEGKKLGIYLYMMTGGEPLVRKNDIIKLAEKHNDVEFGIYTNSTLIDDKFCKDLQRLGNIIPELSIEGTPDTNDARRGEGHYSSVMKAMDLLKKYGIIFGTSICYTSKNYEAVTSDDFIQMLVDKGARFSFYFHLMPVGMKAVPDLMPTKEQRQYMLNRIRFLRSKESDKLFYPMDFQNDGEYVGGCIAGGRNYFHINPAGDAEPCVFIHYSNCNIHDNSILEILKSPLFMEYYKGQPFNKNHLRPCPMLENPELLRKMVKETGARSTDLEAPESVDHLCDKCVEYAKNWAPVAEELWNSQEHKRPVYENYCPEKMKEIYGEE